MSAGVIDRLYVHSPDRLARKYAYQVLLIEEFSRLGVAVVFCNRELGRSPEDDLLLQVQGMMAEYERAKIMERNRRGKLHAARSGSVNVLGGAPYGSRSISKHHGGGQARYEMVADEARVVRQVFDWVGRERHAIGEVCRRLMQAGERTRTGRTVWDRRVVGGMLNNPASMGSAACGKTRQGPLRPRLRSQRGKPLQPRHATAAYDVPREDWLRIAVPALVEPEVFEAVQAQLDENRRHARQSRRGARYLASIIAWATLGSPRWTERSRWQFHRFQNRGKQRPGLLTEKSLGRRRSVRPGEEKVVDGGEALALARQIEPSKLMVAQ